MGSEGRGHGGDKGEVNELRNFFYSVYVKDKEKEERHESRRVNFQV